MNNNYRNYEKILSKKKGIHLAPRRIPVPDGCWMCEKKISKREQEHIFPRWLQKLYNYEKEFANLGHISAEGYFLDKREGVPFNKLTFGGVCGGCNKGWMSKLETDFKKIFTAKSKLEHEDNSITIARWFAKTATLLNVSQQGRVKLPVSARHGLKNLAKLPEGWHVYIFKTNSSEDIFGQLTWQQLQYVYARVPQDTTDKYTNIIDQIYGCCIKTGELVGVVFWHPPEVHDLEAMAPMKRVWPYREGEVSILPWGGALSNRCIIDVVGDELIWKEELSKIHDMKESILRTL